MTQAYPKHCIEKNPTPWWRLLAGCDHMGKSYQDGELRTVSWTHLPWPMIMFAVETILYFHWDLSLVTDSVLQFSMYGPVHPALVLFYSPGPCSYDVQTPPTSKSKGQGYMGHIPVG